ncbi:murein biosynthesis integral membrane protein MurJ [Plantactinospora sp. KBS50]|uniref:murein biosynthesis integral membrane protein MurJ n=1 Tax=Plantactinospora sp. KBS50 TaxID=2024580 RepID=UPI000BAAE0C9|nr:lipid II flippase MurJ [Plantactinospora sp. KBS50]ASW54737.1 virulence factor MviN [Plantactinospora sp. KBS50]
MSGGSPPTGTGAPRLGGRIAGAATLIAVLTVGSRLAGFGRTAVFQSVIGGTDLGAMYVVSNTVPNIIFEIVAGGALASLVVPLLAGAVEAGDRRSVAATTGTLLTWTLGLLLPLAVLVAVFAHPITAVLAADRPAEQVDSAARMLRLFAPQLPLYGVGIVLTGVLQAHRRFAWPVLAPLLSSVTVIGAYTMFAVVVRPGADIAAAGRTGELILAVGTTAGVLVLSLCLLVPLRSLRLRIRPGLRFGGAARSAVGPLALAGGLTVGAQQVALAVTITRLSAGPTNAPALFNLAQTMYLLPWSVLAVPLAVAAYPALAAAHVGGDVRGYRDTLAPTARRVLLFSCLGAAVLAGTAAPVARFFGYPGAPAALAIAGFAPGLLGYGLFAVLSRAMYARGGARPATVAIVAGWAVALLATLLLSALFPVGYRVFAVGCANSIGMLVMGGLLVLAVVRAAGADALRGLRRTALVGLLAGAVAAAGGALSAYALARAMAGTPAKPAAVVAGMLTGVVTGVMFFAAAYPLDRQDVRLLARNLRRRLPGAARRTEG